MVLASQAGGYKPMKNKNKKAFQKIFNILN